MPYRMNDLPDTTTDAPISSPRRWLGSLRAMPIGPFERAAWLLLCLAAPIDWVVLVRFFEINALVLPGVLHGMCMVAGIVAHFGMASDRARGDSNVPTARQTRWAVLACLHAPACFGVALIALAAMAPALVLYGLYRMGRWVVSGDDPAT